MAQQPPAPDSTPDSPLTRTEVSDAQKRMRRGVRFSVTWRFGANDDYEESGLETMTGVVVSTEETGDGSTATLVNYEPHPKLPLGGILEFPPTSVDGRPVWVYRVVFVRRPGTMPDLTLYTRPVQEFSLEPPTQVQVPAGIGSGVGQKRDRSRSPAPEAAATTSMTEAFDRIADRLEGHTTRKEVGRTGIKVPLNTTTTMSVFYPNIWIGRAMEWKTAFHETILELGVVFRSGRSLASWLLRLRPRAHEGRVHLRLCLVEPTCRHMRAGGRGCGGGETCLLLSSPQ